MPPLPPLLAALEALADLPDDSRLGRCPRVVIDTNTVLALIYWRDPALVHLASSLGRRRFVILASIQTAHELAGVLSRPQFRLEAEEAASRLRDWLENAVWIAGEELAKAEAANPIRCRDPEDQKFLTLALAGGARLIVTRDKLLLKAGRRMKRFGIKAIRPEEWTDSAVFEPDGKPSPFCTRIGTRQAAIFR